MIKYNLLSGGSSGDQGHIVAICEIRSWSTKQFGLGEAWAIGITKQEIPWNKNLTWNCGKSHRNILAGIMVSLHRRLVGCPGEKPMQLSSPWNTHSKVVQCGHGKKKTERDPSNFAEIATMRAGSWMDEEEREDS